MKKQTFNYLFIALAVLLSASSCNDVWNEHYGEINAKKSSLNLYEYMQTVPELSTFTNMLKVTGYDSILSKPQTYTVWAPVNSALQGISLKDTATVTDIVKNHISRFSIPTSDITTKTIYMLGKKFIDFKQTANGYTFGGKLLMPATSNVATANGILHSIDGYVPYFTNIWEYIGKTPGLDSLRNYLYAQSLYVFDAKNSVEIGTNSIGQSVYDSIISFSNPVLDKIGHIYTEDSLFTAILPNNTAWAKAYNKIKANYKMLDKDGGAAAQRANAQAALVENLVFKTLVPDTAGLTSLKSTTGSVFKSPGYLFKAATKVDLSNGLGYVTDSIRFKAEESYQKSIKVEAESSSYGRSFDASLTNIYILSSLGSAFADSISNGKYLVIEPLTVNINTPNSVTFPIPNTLSGKYKVYCVFVPSSIASADNMAKQNKVKFYFSYLDSKGVQVSNVPVSATNVINTAVGAAAGTFTVKAAKMNKIYVTQITFPYCNLYNSNSTSASITTKLRVDNAAKITETVAYDQTLRIDYILLEPAP